MGTLLTCLCLDSFCKRRFGQLQNVRVTVTFKGSHRPDGKITDVLASTLARTTAADTLVNYSLMYVPQRPVFSHRPDGKVADVLAPTHACQTANTSVSIM
jgi:hypothetical protein